MKKRVLVIVPFGRFDFSRRAFLYDFLEKDIDVSSKLEILPEPDTDFIDQNTRQFFGDFLVIAGINKIGKCLFCYRKPKDSLLKDWKLCHTFSSLEGNQDQHCRYAYYFNWIPTGEGVRVMIGCPSSNDNPGSIELWEGLEDVSGVLTWSLEKITGKPGDRIFGNDIKINDNGNLSFKIDIDKQH